MVKSHTSQLAAAALLAGFWCTSAAAPVSEPERNGAKIAALREVLDKWVDMQKALAKEKSEAKQAAQLLEQRIDLLSHEVEDLQKKKTESEKGITEADVKKAEMVKKKEAAIQSLEALAGEMPKMEVELRALQPRLPDPL